MIRIFQKRRISFILFAFPLGLSLVPSFSSELSSLSMSLPAAQIEPPKKAAPELFTDHEKKILTILSQFRTGLKPDERERLVTFISEESRRYGFEPELIMALISTESSFYNWSSSPKGAIGLMQLIPTTGREMAEINNIVWQGEKDVLFDPFVNIKLGVHYLSMLHLRFKNIELALTAYNYGPGNVRRWIDEGEALPAGYAMKVLKFYERFLAFDMEKQQAAELLADRDDDPSELEEKIPSENVSKVSLRF